MIEMLVFAAVLVAAVWILSVVFREEPLFDEVCIETGCHRVATHERPIGVTADGTEMVELVCSRHGRFPR